MARHRPYLEFARARNVCVFFLGGVEGHLTHKHGLKTCPFNIGNVFAKSWVTRMNDGCEKTNQLARIRNCSG